MGWRVAESDSGVVGVCEQKGLPLGAVNLLVLPVVVGCTSLVTALGVTALAAHTIVKQVPPVLGLFISSRPCVLGTTRFAVDSLRNPLSSLCLDD